MKNSIRLLSIILLSAYYISECFSKPIEGFGNCGASSTEQQGYFTDISTKLYYPQKTENITISIGNFPVQNLKDPTSSFGEIVEETLQLFKSQFLQYTNFRKTFLLQYRKADLIFPFHYFW